MPTYQYACTTCGHRLEAVQAFTDEPLSECPECEGRLRKLFGSVGVVFKGPGFYRTDSRASGKDQASGNGSGSKEKEKTDAGGASKSSESSSSNGSGSSSGSGSKDGSKDKVSASTTA